ncbi:hypothetical protein F5Y18DRAFT_130666 [Xylariaceae sp. FL1019]|nr:hypothetical protein F5Y18DRAFT_130666 [Xylariaceae sp. FL1019]
MAGKTKSKFTFPVPGWPSRKKDADKHKAPSSPLSKAQKILGADGINTGSSRLGVGPGRGWETSSNGGISISVSESSASQATNDTGFDRTDGNGSGTTSFGQTLWEQESAIIPRQLRSAHGPQRIGLKTQLSARPVGGGSTDISASRRRNSTSTIDSERHYDSTKMPLYISQQTSSSAMAKGIPPKINMILDIDGTLAGPQPKKKGKPAKLDLSRLRPKSRKGRNQSEVHGEPILGNNYVMRSPSFMTTVSPATEDSRRTPRKLMKQGPTNESQLTAPGSSRSRGMSNTSELHQLYNHYEQTTFRDEPGFENEDDGDSDGERLTNAPRPDFTEPNLRNQEPSNVITHDFVAPLPSSSARGYGMAGKHSRNGSHDSRMSASIAENQTTTLSATRHDYAGSISSRHTRTSKASPSIKSTLDNDRLQNSVLSLSDSSDDDEAIESFPVPPLHRPESGIQNATADHLELSGQPNASQIQIMNGTKKFVPSLDQLNEHFESTLAPKSHITHSRSNNTLHSSRSSMSTLTPHQIVSMSASDSRLSMRSTETLDTLGSSRQPEFSVQEARAVSFGRLASTAEAASRVPMPDSVESLKALQKVSRQNSTRSRISNMSHASDQPTPPLSPNSVEFYVKSRESLQRDAAASENAETNNARLMAVTRQEEMLLAALRKKRAKMHESAILGAKEDGEGQSSPGSGSKESSTKPKGAAHHSASKTRNWPKRSSSLFMGASQENLRQNKPSDKSQSNWLDTETTSSLSRSRTTTTKSTEVTNPTHLPTDPRHERVLLYLHRPVENVNTSKISETSPDSDYMDDSDGQDLVVNERRTSRMQARRESNGSGPIRERSVENTSSPRQSVRYSNPRTKDSIPLSPLSVPTQRHRLHDVPEVELESDINEDIDADDLDDDYNIDAFPQPAMPPMPPPLGPLPSVPKNRTSQIHVSPLSETFFPSPSAVAPKLPEHKPGHIKSKRSMVRLSAVGFVNTPSPHWGDDD